MKQGVDFYIKGEAKVPVFFPKGKADCRHCTFHRYTDSYRTYHCALTDMYIDHVELDRRPEHCPVVFPDFEDMLT